MSGAHIWGALWQANKTFGKAQLTMAQHLRPASTTHHPRPYGKRTTSTILFSRPHGMQPPRLPLASATWRGQEVVGASNPHFLTRCARTAHTPPGQRRTTTVQTTGPWGGWSPFGPLPSRRQDHHVSGQWQGMAQHRPNPT